MMLVQEMRGHEETGTFGGLSGEEWLLVVNGWATRRSVRVTAVRTNGDELTFCVRSGMGIDHVLHLSRRFMGDAGPGARHRAVDAAMTRLARVRASENLIL
ncbi:MAG: hypothetical protein KIT14_18090 [bacterium]|nr:hypothetical protein [bacterium]